MRDPHIHVEKTPMPGFGHPAMRALISVATGLVPDPPKTVGTGCGRRRPIARTSSRAASGLTCGRRRNPRSDLHGCRWLSSAVVDRIRFCDGPQTAPAVSLPPP